MWADLQRFQNEQSLSIFRKAKPNIAEHPDHVLKPFCYDQRSQNSDKTHGMPRASSLGSICTPVRVNASGQRDLLASGLRGKVLGIVARHCLTS